MKTLIAAEIILSILKKKTLYIVWISINIGWKEMWFINKRIRSTPFVSQEMMFWLPQGQAFHSPSVIQKVGVPKNYRDKVCWPQSKKFHLIFTLLPLIPCWYVARCALLVKAMSSRTVEYILLFYKSPFITNIVLKVQIKICSVKLFFFQNWQKLWYTL